MPIRIAVIKEQKQKIISFDDSVEKLELLGITGINVNWCSHYGKRLLLSLKPEKAMVTHSGTLVWKIPWMEEPGRLQSMGLQRVGHN